MIPYILAAVGGYLIGDSLKGKQFAEGGMMAKGGMVDFSKDGYVKAIRDAKGKIMKEINVGGEVYRYNSVYKTYNSTKNNELLHKSKYSDGGYMVDFSKDGYVKAIRDAKGKIVKEINVGGEVYRYNSVFKTYNSTKNNELLHKSMLRQLVMTANNQELRELMVEKKELEKYGKQYAEGGMMARVPKKSYYHVIEESGYGRIGSHNFYTNLEEAEKEVKRLSEFFPKSYFYVYESASKKEPVICTV